jgi:hypothetical protein
MARLLVLLARPTTTEQEAAGGDGPGSGVNPAVPGALLVGWVLLLLATVGATWTMPLRWLEVATVPRIYAAGLIDATWPVVFGALAAVVAAALVRRLGSGRPSRPWVPAGDLVVLVEAAAPAVSRLAARVVRVVTAVRDRVGGLIGRFEARVRPGQGFAHLDVVLRRWQVAGLLFVLVTVSLLVALHGSRLRG